MADYELKFEPITGEESPQARIEAFNRLGLGINRLHECIDRRFSQVEATLEERGQSIEGIETRLARVAKSMANARDSQVKWKNEMRAQLAATNQTLDSLRAGLLDKPTVGSMSQKKAIGAGIVIAALAAVPGVIALVKVLAPAAHAAFAAMLAMGPVR